MNEEAKSASEAERALIIRSAPSWLFEKALDTVKAGRDVTVDVYCPKAVTPQFDGRDDINEVIDDNWEGFYKSSFVTHELVEKLKVNRYDHVLILYNDTFGEGYGPLRKLAFKINPGRVSSFDINMVFSGLKGEGVIGRFFLPRKWFYNIMIVVFAIEIIATTLWDKAKFLLKRALSMRPTLPTKHTR